MDVTFLDYPDLTWNELGARGIGENRLGRYCRGDHGGGLSCHRCPRAQTAGTHRRLAGGGQPGLISAFLALKRLDSYQSSALSEDAITIRGIGIGIGIGIATGALSARARHSAVWARVATHQGSSRVNPYGDTVLRLYVLQGQPLRPVLDNMLVDVVTGDWDGARAGTLSETRRLLPIDPARQHGYATLRISANTRASVSKQTSRRARAQRQATGARELHQRR